MQLAIYTRLFNMKSLYPKNHWSSQPTYSIVFDIEKSSLFFLLLERLPFPPVVLQLMTASTYNEA